MIERTKKKPQIINSETIFEGRIPPHAKDLEEAVLGAMMIERDGCHIGIDEIKTEQVFYYDPNKKIFTAIKELYNDNEAVDILTVSNKLKSKGELNYVGGAYYITQLTARVSSSANIEFHCRILLQKYVQREVIKTSYNAIQEAFNDKVSALDLMPNLHSGLTEIQNNIERKQSKSVDDVMNEIIQNLEDRANGKSKGRGVRTGFDKIDNVTNGDLPSDLIILAARPGMGKTAFAVSSMVKRAKMGYKVAFFSLEMSKTQLINRIICDLCKSITINDLKFGISPDDTYKWEELYNAKKIINDLPIYIDDCNYDIWELSFKCKKMKREHDVDYIYIDYLQIIDQNDRLNQPREQYIATCSRTLKKLAKLLDIPICALSQLSRSLETRGGAKRPMLSDLRESGAIEQDADMVIFIYRPEYYGISQDEEGKSTIGVAEIIIAKYRNGSVGTIEIGFDGSRTKFYNL